MGCFFSPYFSSLTFRFHCSLSKKYHFLCFFYHTLLIARVREKKICKFDTFFLTLRIFLAFMTVDSLKQS